VKAIEPVKQIFVAKDLFSTKFAKQTDTLESQSSRPAKLLEQSQSQVKSQVDTDSAVVLNPLSSAEALKVRQQLLMDTKERERWANESPVMKSVFDFKGNSKFKQDEFVAVEKSKFVNPFAQSTTADSNIVAPTTFINPFKQFEQPVSNPFKNPF
jgi:hypothetical protein